MHLIHTITLFLVTIAVSASAENCLSKFVGKFLSKNYVTLVDYKPIILESTAVKILTLPVKRYDVNNAYPDITSDYIVYVKKLELIERTFSELQQDLNWNPRGRYLVITENPENITEVLLNVTWREYVSFRIIIGHFQNKTLHFYSWYPYKWNSYCARNVVPDYLGTCEEINEDPFQGNLPQNLANCPLTTVIHHYRTLQKYYYLDVVNTFGQLIKVPNR